MSKEEINAIVTILDQCRTLYSHSQKILASMILSCITPVLRNLEAKREESDA